MAEQHPTSEIKSWSDLTGELFESTIEYCKWNELLLIACVDSQWNAHIRQPNCWKHVVFTETSIPFSKRPPFSPEGTLLIHRILYQCPLLKQISHLQWRITRGRSDQFRDIIQLFPNVETFEISDTTSDIPSEFWDAFACPLTNVFSSKLRQLHIDSCGYFLLRHASALSADCFPNLRSLSLNFEKLIPDTELFNALVRLGQLTRLTVIVSGRVRTSTNTAPSLADYTRLVNALKYLEYFETNYRISAEILNLFKCYSNISLAIYFYQKRNALSRFTPQAILLLEECQCFYQPPNRNIVVLTKMIESKYIFKDLVKYCKQFKKRFQINLAPRNTKTRIRSLLVDDESSSGSGSSNESVNDDEDSNIPQPNEIKDVSDEAPTRDNSTREAPDWFDTPNCLAPFRQMALCEKLESIDICFRKNSTISVEQIQCLRPIYNQLLSLQLRNLTLTHLQLNALLLEIEKIPHLKNTRVFKQCRIVV